MQNQNSSVKGAIKVAHFVDSTNLGGAERMAINLLNALNEQSVIIPFLIISRKEGFGSTLLDQGIKKVVLEKKNPVDVSAFRRLLGFIRNNDIQILHAHGTSFFWAVIAKVFMPRIKVVWHDHFGFRHSTKSASNNLIKTMSFLLSGYIGVSKNLLDWAEKNIRIGRGHKVLLGNFPDLPDTASPSRYTRKGDPVFLLLGNYREEKNHLWLVEVFQDVVKELPQSELWFAGKDIDPSYKAEVLKSINDLKLQNHITDWGECRDVGSAIAQCDIGVFASKFEALPVSLLEFGLLSKPVVSTAVGQIPEILGDGSRGFLIPPGEKERFADTLVQLGKDKQLQNKMGQRLNEYVNENYSKQKVVSNLIDFYRKILNGVA